MRSGAKRMDPSASRIVTSMVRARFEGSPGVPAENVLCLCPGSPVPAQAKVGSSASPNIAMIRIVAPLFMLHLHTGHRARLDRPQVCFPVRIQGRWSNRLLGDVDLHFVRNGTSRMLVPAGVLVVVGGEALAYFHCREHAAHLDGPKLAVAGHHR